jgi:hypothetical protein
MKKPFALSVIIFVLILNFYHCKNKPKQASAFIVKETVLDSIPSGSGIEKHNDSLFIVGDDAAYLYKLSLHNNGYHSVRISQQTMLTNRVDRNNKPDYEAAVLLNFRGGVYLFAFGSGSTSPARDSLLIIDVSNFKVDTIVNIKRFYDHLKYTSSTDVKDWNLEAAAVVGKKMLLFNRGNNFIFSFDAEAFVDYILSTGFPPPPIKYVKASLPSIEDYEARLSGATAMDKRLLFSASVEKTTDWRNDGPVLGSYVGEVDETGHLSVAARVSYADGRASQHKIESIAFLKKAANGDIILAAISDNDDGKSRLLEIHLKEN